MQTHESKRFSFISRGVLAVISALGLGLVITGWLLIPTASPLSGAAAGLMPLLYAFAAVFILPRIPDGTLRRGTLLGLLAGAVFASEIALEYILLPKDNTSWGLVEFGLVFALFFAAGAWAAYSSGRLRDGSLGGVSAALFSSAIWLVAVLGFFYAFRGRPRQAQVFLAEGNYADFASSGMHDFATFVMEDFFGAAFYHLLLGPLLAAILGLAGGLAGSLVRRIFGRR